MKEILAVKNLSKAFKKKKVIDNLSFCVYRNSVFGFVGRNGAGKTTTMKMILDFLQPDTGSILFDGEDIAKTKHNAGRIGYLPDVPEFYDFYTPMQYMMFCGEISNIRRRECKEKAEELLKLVGLEKDKDRKIRGFSRGMKQRLGVAQALLSDPELIICDEPTSALDPIGRREILDLLKKAKERTAVIFSTHILSDVQRICDYIGIIENGKIVRYGTTQELTRISGDVKVRISCEEEEDRNRLLEEAKKTELCRDVQVENNDVIIQVENEKKVKDLFKWIGEKGCNVNSIRKEEKTLEDIYMEVIK
ncbi:MAG: ABC transporter ATP-binding protein [Lachnospiraceae bacterium]|nr:ABC transporter ATP-binding protein [Lachnospiraceae bacterium]